MRNVIITIDGPGGAGKSTVSRRLAEKLDCLYLDTGAMYRALALEVKRKGLDARDTPGLMRLCRKMDLNFRRDSSAITLYLGDEDISQFIRTPEMDMLSSSISKVKEVRMAMTGLQRKIGEKGGLVAEGRDMGTVVFPHADFKFFLTASPEARADRRYKERRQRGESVSREDVAMALIERDHQDQTRAIAPLRPAEDARTIDTTDLKPEEVVETILKEIEKTGIRKHMEASPI